MASIIVTVYLFGMIVGAYLSYVYFCRQMKKPAPGRSCPIPKPRDVKINTEDTSRVLSRLQNVMKGSDSCQSGFSSGS